MAGLGLHALGDPAVHAHHCRQASGELVLNLVSADVLERTLERASALGVRARLQRVEEELVAQVALLDGEVRVVLDGVRDAAEEVATHHRGLELTGEHLDRAREAAGDGEERLHAVGVVVRVGDLGLAALPPLLGRGQPRRASVTIETESLPCLGSE